MTRNPDMARDRRTHREALARPMRPSDACGANDTAKAVEYALWLADRRGVVLDTFLATPEPVLEPLPGTAPSPRTMRIRAVRFGDVTVNLPGWDFLPCCRPLPEDPF